MFVFFLMIRRPPRSTQSRSSAASDVYKRQVLSEVQRLCHKIAIIKQGRILKVEEIQHLRKEQFKTVTVEFENRDEPVLNIEGIIALDRTPRQDHFMFKGDLHELLHALSQRAITNILIEEPSLEDIFMHYYER